MSASSWHFPRTMLAKQVMGMFESGLSTALVFFAPRRMGKTEFLLRDIQPTAEKSGWLVFYHSFLDASKDAEQEFSSALQEYLSDNSLLSKSKQAASKIKKLSAGAMGFQGSVELQADKTSNIDFKKILTQLAEHHKVVLLMDEIQALAKDEKNLPFVTALRTVLDVNKDKIKVIFTGSSREGLKKMFSAKDAPFFHFGQNLSFPQFGAEFTDYLAEKYCSIAQKSLDKTQLWKAFEELGKLPQLIRSLVERLILHPELSINKAKQDLLEELASDRSFETQWEKFSSLEQHILTEISLDNQKLYSTVTRQKIAIKLGLENVSVSLIQSAIRKLNKNCIIGHLPERGEYFIDDPNFKDWVLQK